MEAKTKKITMATVKAFIRKNADNLYVKVNSSFDGMTDCVQHVKDNYRKISANDAIGINGVWVVGESRDRINIYSDNEYTGYEIYNCCGSGIIVTKK